MAHDIDNLSDHEPLFGVFDISVSRSACVQRKYCKRLAWYKASCSQMLAYKECLVHELSSIAIPTDALLCRNLECNDLHHTYAVNQYCQEIYECCFKSGESAIPMSGGHCRSRTIAGWIEYARPYREKSLYWQRIWADAG